MFGGSALASGRTDDSFLMRNVSSTPSSRRAAAHRFRLFREVLIVGLGYLVYSQVRGMAADRTFDAFTNANRLIDLEQNLGIFRELALQTWVLPNDTLLQVFNVIYFYGFFPLLLPTAAWLFFKHPSSYVLLRNAFLISGGIAVFFFLLLPTAPPRLLPGLGFVDTLSRSLAPSYDSIPGVNHFAALPSMHVGWSLLTTIGLYMALGGSRLRWFVWLLPAAMTTSTVVTGNHYFLDGALGMVVALVGLGIAIVMAEPARYWALVRWPEPASEPPLS